MGRWARAFLAATSTAAIATVSVREADAQTKLQAQTIDVAELPPGTTRVPASDEECAVWRREQGFARSVAAHDAAAFADYLHPGTVFNAGAPNARRGSEAVAHAWAGIITGRGIALRWRAGIVQIGGDGDVALSRGPYILQQPEGGGSSFEVGLFQTVWRRQAAGAPWRVLFDAPASTPLPMPDRAAADAWVAGQPTSDCAER